MPPDAWTFAVGLWGAHAQVTTDAYTGGRAVRLVANGTRLDSQAMTARPGDRYSVDVMVRAAQLGTPLFVHVVWYDGALKLLSVATTSAEGARSCPYKCVEVEAGRGGKREAPR